MISHMEYNTPQNTLRAGCVNVHCHLTKYHKQLFVTSLEEIFLHENHFML